MKAARIFLPLSLCSMLLYSCAVKRDITREVIIEVKKGDIERGFLFVKPLNGKIISRFGRRKSGMHEGVDIKAPYGTEIVASADGIVKFSGTMRGYGKTIIIDHGNGYETLYAHNSVNLVQKGQRVRLGERIALVGKTGNASTPHLHFEIIHKGKKEDPERYLKW